MRRFRLGLLCTLALTVAACGRTNTASTLRDESLGDLVTHLQEQSNWCWAAISQTVLGHLGTEVTQCHLASRFIANSSEDVCCDGDGSRPECNQGNKIWNVLGPYGAMTSHRTGAVSASVLDDELANDRPVVVRIAWDGGDAHYLLVHGSNGAGLYTVFDPLRGDRDLSFAEVRRYEDAGTWADTVLVP